MNRSMVRRIVWGLMVVQGVRAATATFRSPLLSRQPRERVSPVDAGLDTQMGRLGADGVARAVSQRRTAASPTGERLVEGFPLSSAGGVHNRAWMR